MRLSPSGNKHLLLRIYSVEAVVGQSNVFTGDFDNVGGLGPCRRGRRGYGRAGAGGLGYIFNASLGAKVSVYFVVAVAAGTVGQSVD